MARLARFRAVPWLLLFELARVAKSHLDESLTGADRRRVLDIVRASKGDPRRLSRRERDDLRDIARKLDLARLVRDMAPAVMTGRGRRRR
ncbi:MAG TPA: hypothetical protein VHB30_09870 [Solirubrobacteraceae bacterium]|jgi:hypothetical protein|nr:hypothetical protein [Solirubrobacteraceae bacterium]